MQARTEMGAIDSLRQSAAPYIVIGGMAAVIDLGVFSWLGPHVHPTFVAAVASFATAAVFNYTMASIWVYRKSWRSLRRASSFLVFALLGVGVNASVTAALADWMMIPPTLAKVAGIGVAFCSNFVLNTIVVFRR